MDAAPDLVISKQAKIDEYSTPPKPDCMPPTFVALGPLGDTAQGVETKLGPNWSRKGDFPLSARYLKEDLGPGSPPILGNIFLDSSPYLAT